MTRRDKVATIICAVVFVCNFYNGTSLIIANRLCLGTLLIGANFLMAYSLGTYLYFKK